MGQIFFSKDKVNGANEITTKDKVECKGKRKEDDEKFRDMIEVFNHEEGNMMVKDEEKTKQRMCNPNMETKCFNLWIVFVFLF